MTTIIIDPLLDGLSFSTDMLTTISNNETEFYNTTSVPMTTTTIDPLVQAQVDYYTTIANSMRLYVTPLIIFGGTVGNILTIAVVLSRHFRYSPSSVLLLALAIVDIGVLYFNLLDVWLGALLGGESLQPTRDHNEVSCKASVFITYFLTHSSSWILVLINVDRVISVYQPLKARTWCTKKRLGLALAVMFAVLASISVHVFWTIAFFDELPNYKCRFDMPHPKAEQAWLVIDAIMFTFAPFGIILGCNVAIIMALARATRRRKKTMNVRSSGSSPADSTTSITTMLLTISISFLLITSPLTMCYQFYDALLTKYDPSIDPAGYALYMELVINTVLVLLCYSNNAINFLLYCISGSKFRKALSDLCGCKKKGGRGPGDGYSMATSVTTTVRNSDADKMNMVSMNSSVKRSNNGQPPPAAAKYEVPIIVENGQQGGYVNTSCQL